MRRGTSGAVSDALPTRSLGRGGPEITTAGFGAWAIGGGDWAYGWGPQDDADSVAAIRRAWRTASTGSTPQPSTASAIRRRSSPAR